MRPIDADDVIERLDMMCDAGGCLLPVTEAVRSFCKWVIDHQPTIKAEAIIKWNKRADRTARDPENYKKVSYDGIYFCVDGKTPTEMLAERDPDENYIGTELECLDAYERQLKRWGIKVNGVDAKVTIQKFKQNEETEKLFPEFIRRSLNCSIRELCELFMRVTG